MRISVALRICGPDLSPESVTRLLGASPTEQHRTGDENRGPSGRIYSPFSSGLWSLESDLNDEASFSEKIMNILDRVDSTRLKELIATDARVDLFVGIFLNEEPSNVLLNSETSQRVGDIGLAVDIAIYP